MYIYFCNLFMCEWVWVCLRLTLALSRARLAYWLLASIMAIFLCLSLKFETFARNLNFWLAGSLKEAVYAVSGQNFDWSLLRKFPLLVAHTHTRTHMCVYINTIRCSATGESKITMCVQVKRFVRTGVRCCLQPSRWASKKRLVDSLL